jgi:glycolate oxidase iron-sulfur subunit
MTGIAIDSKKLQACIHCGLCLEACPTYLETGEEMSSPRGRIYLMKALEEGTITAGDPSFHEHELSCVECRSCETACPSGVEFGFLMEQTRDIIRKEKPSFLRKFIYTKALGNKPLTSIAQAFLFFIVRTRIAALLEKIVDGTRLKRLTSSLSLLPKDIRFPHGRQSVYEHEGEYKGSAAILIGCIGDVFTARTNDATIRVLQRLGYDVHILSDVKCCGSLAIHNGYYDNAKELARKNIGTVLSSNVDFFISNIAGCGAMLKDYTHILNSNEAGKFREKVFDISEFLYRFHRDDISRFLTGSKYAGKRIGYQSPCHLVHGQKIISDPLDLLSFIRGAEAFAFEENNICCGSAGSYNIEHPEMGEALLERKMKIISKAGPDIIATANSGCMMQLRKGAGKQIPVKHVIEILAESL